MRKDNFVKNNQKFLFGEGGEVVEEIEVFFEKSLIN